ncbi:MAG: 2OG-Fe dioxygenase family protein [Sphingomonas sp.]|uniref:2OG-Fe dioxygenase family protein n=1 Tax=Sphingomonas sp. TaxID=28214 RepID=UPI0035656C19
MGDDIPGNEVSWDKVSEQILESIGCDVRRDGFAFVSSAQMLDMLPRAALDGWRDFAATWNDLPRDLFMGDGGRYRRRRYAVLHQDAGALERKPHQAHYQSDDHNPLNGGIDRWFEPMTDLAAANPVVTALLDLCWQLIASVTGERAISGLDVKMHQFRIEPSEAGKGQPTPEGIHRDGVDWAAVLLIGRQNVDRGGTVIQDGEGDVIGSGALTQPLDLLFLDDRRVLHGVDALHRLDPGLPGYRDVLVATFQRSQAGPLG